MRQQRGPAFGGQGGLSNVNSSGVSFGSAPQSKAVASLLEGACTSGVLRLNNKGLRTLPGEMFRLNELEYQSKAWWLEADLTVVDVGNNELTSLEPHSSTHTSANGPSGRGGVGGGGAPGTRPTSSAMGSGFEIFCSLRSLLASRNKIDAISVQLLQALKQLTKLDLSYNKLALVPECSAISQFMPLLQEVDLSNNQLTEVCGFSLCQNLFVLRLSCNRLQAFEDWTAVERETGRRVPGGPHGPALFPSLRILSLSQNRLKGFSDSRLLQSASVLAEVDLSQNELSTLRSPDGSSLFGNGPQCFSKLQILNLRQNKIQLLEAVDLQCPHLKDLQVGFNRITDLPLDVFRCSPEISILDLSNNAISDVTAVASLRDLRRLDVQNNNLSNLPARLAALRQLTSLVVDGNPLRAIRREIVQKGAVEILKYLRSRLTPEEMAELGLVEDTRKATQVAQVETVDVNLLVRGSYGGGSASNAPPPHQQMQPSDSGSTPAVIPRGKGYRSNASSINLFGPPSNDADAYRTSIGDVKLVQLGDRSGSVWDISLAKKQQPKNFRSVANAEDRGRFGEGSLDRREGRNNAVLPAELSIALSLTTLHNPEESALIRTLKISGQSTVQRIRPDFLAAFTHLVELEADGTSIGTAAAADPQRGGPRGSNVDSIQGISFDNTTPATLQRLSFASCGFSGPFPHSIFAGPVHAHLKLTRLNLAGNRITDLPTSMPVLAGSLQYLSLSSNEFQHFPSVLFGFHQLIELQLDHNRLPGLEHLDALFARACQVEGFDWPPNSPWSPEPAKTVGAAECCWPKLSLLDLSYNDMDSLPLKLCYLGDHLRSLKVEGNRIKLLRQEILERGTVAILEFLRQRIVVNGPMGNR
jgi:Leucine-rich repeat (LRR) protein